MTDRTNSASNHVSEDTCLDLVHGLVDLSARRTALDHMRSCEDCEMRLRETAASHLRALATANTLAKPARGEPISPIARPRTRVALIAASLVGAVGLSFFLNRPSSDRTSFDGATVRLPAAELRGATRDFRLTKVDSVVLDGLDAYQSGDYPLAKHCLTQGHANERFEDVRRIYLGCTLLELGEPATARAELIGVKTALVPEPWRSESLWALAVAASRSGHAAAADSILQRLIRDGGPLSDRARAHVNASGRNR